mgnify:CR=1 FL=1
MGNSVAGEEKMKSIGLALSVIITTLSLLVSESNGTEASILAKIKAATTYIFIKNAGTFTPSGTGFFVGLKIPSKPSNFDLYLVTAKHALYQPGTNQFLDTIYISLNKKGGGSELTPVPVTVQGANKTVFVHPDPSVDIAVLPGMPDQKRYDYRFITDEFLLNKMSAANLKLYEGFEIFYPSLFPGSGGNYPFFRYGRFALITDDQIEWQGKPTSLYLIETGLSGENRGAPVFFFWEDTSGLSGQSRLKLAGVIQGNFGDVSSEITGKNKAATPFSNLGITAVIPGYKLHEILFGEELRALRRKRGF